MKNSTQFLDRIFYINLDRRSDRQLHMTNEFHRMGLESELIERFPAISHTFNEEGIKHAQSLVESGLYKDIQHMTYDLS